MANSISFKAMEISQNELSTKTRYVHRPEGRIAYDVSGSGPLILSVPGMGDLRSTYRFLTPALVAAGFRVATMDLRGHGDSDATFASYDDEATADDIAALIAELGGPAIVVGNSMGAGAAVLASVNDPDAVSGLVLIGPFVRNPRSSKFVKALMRIAMTPALIRPVWNAYLPSLYAGVKGEDFEEHRRRIAQALKRPGHTAAFSKTTATSHAPVEAVLDRVRVPVLIVMGALDPDFPEPAAEAQWIADAVSGEVAMVAEAGHYPQAQRPDVVSPAVVDFAHRAVADA